MRMGFLIDSYIFKGGGFYRRNEKLLNLKYCYLAKSSNFIMFEECVIS